MTHQLRINSRMTDLHMMVEKFHIRFVGAFLTFHDRERKSNPFINLLLPLFTATSGVRCKMLYFFCLTVRYAIRGCLTEQATKWNEMGMQQLPESNKKINKLLS